MFRFERADLNYGFAAAGSLLVAGLLVVTIVWGGAAASGVFGFILTGLAFASTPSLSTGRAVVFGLLGAGLTFLASVTAGHTGWSALVLGAVAALAALAAGRSPHVAVRWSLLAVWTLVALLVVEEGAEAEAAVSFVVGSGLATALAAASRARKGRDVATAELPRSMAVTATWFAIAKGLAVAAGVVVGFWWFQTAPYWVALTVLIVAQPDDVATIRKALARSLGTVLGVVMGALIVSVAGESETWVAVALIGLVFGQMLFMKIHYVLYATFLTGLIVVASSLTTSDVSAVGWARISATVVGAVLAVAVTELTPRLADGLTRGGTATG